MYYSIVLLQKVTNYITSLLFMEIMPYVTFALLFLTWAGIGKYKGLVSIQNVYIKYMSKLKKKKKNSISTISISEISEMSHQCSHLSLPWFFII